jgi:SAM-dependent methyltransferase
MKREIESELLDALPADDPRAIRSRRDLQRVNAVMGQARIMARALEAAFTDRIPRSIVELGAGDGTLLLRLAKRIAPRWKPMRVVLVDRQRLLSSQTEAEFEELSWHVESVEADAFDWLERPNPEPCDVTIATLFLHHFREGDLRRLLSLAARQTGFFLACEPERAYLSLCGASLLGLIGCNDVTRHDGKISVRAGFVENELSDLWPAREDWRLVERQAGLFTHCFAAQRIGDSS